MNRQVTWEADSEGLWKRERYTIEVIRAKQRRGHVTAMIASSKNRKNQWRAK
jgi:hypothetical protein